MRLADPDLRHFAPDGWDVEKRRERLLGFVERNRVTPFKMTGRNLHKFLAMGGSSESEVTSVVKDVFGCAGFGVLLQCQARGCPFDHGVLWGRDRTPMFLTGCPYDLSTEAMASLLRLEDLGMWVHVDARSWYGFDTLSVRVYHKESWLPMPETPKRTEASLTA